MDSPIIIFGVVQAILNILAFIGLPKIISWVIKNQIDDYKGLKKTVAQHTVDIVKLQEEYEKTAQISEAFHRETQLLVTRSLESYSNKLHDLEKNIVNSIETKIDRYVLKEVCQTKNCQNN